MAKGVQKLQLINLFFLCGQHQSVCTATFLFSISHMTHIRTKIDLKQNALHMQSQVSSKSGNMASTFSSISFHDSVVHIWKFWY